MDLSKLQGFVQQVHPLSADEWAAFALIWEPFEAKRKTILTMEGSVERYVYFVLDGIQRAYFVGADGKEATLVFSYPYSFTGVADSFLLQTPSKYYFETLTASQFLKAPFPELERIMLRHHGIERLIRLFTSHALAGVLARQIELQSCSAEARFRNLLQRSPHVLNLIPHKYLANYLGIDPTNFSKILHSVRL